MLLHRITVRRALPEDPVHLVVRKPYAREERAPLAANRPAEDIFHFPFYILPANGARPSGRRSPISLGSRPTKTPVIRP